MFYIAHLQVLHVLALVWLAFNKIYDNLWLYLKINTNLSKFIKNKRKKKSLNLSKNHNKNVH